MKTLYISDLDGTLLNSSAELSEYTINTLNALISDGVYFSVATARTAATSAVMLERVAVNVPIILMNGVLIYDLQKKNYIKKDILSRSAAEQIIGILKQTGQSGLMYTLDNGEMTVYYERLGTKYLRDFVEERVLRYNKKFTQTDDFAEVEADIIYFTFMDSGDNIRQIYDAVKNINGINTEMYRDIYSEDFWYLEIFSETASKYNAAQFLRSEYGFDKIVGFGDNLNDIPLFKACDECYAVGNAKNEVKEKATAVIGSNGGDGVAKWMEGNIS